MEPNKETYGAELPEPLQEGSTEVQPIATPEIQPTQTSAPATTPVPSQPAPIAPTAQPAVPPVAPSTSVSTAQLVADDNDLIEKEWVEKAKAIVAQTAHDPNLQSKEVNKIKVDYMQKRYNKQLKVDES
jgi:hypothetical protein